MMVTPLSHADRAGRAAGHGVARQAQPRTARETVRLDGQDRVGAVGQGHRAAYLRGDRAPLLGRGCSLRFHGAADIPALLQQAHERGSAIDLSDITYYVGHETVVPGEDEKALPRWVEALFAFMQRNSAHLTEYFKPPVGAVVEIRREVSI
jgi:hypothetical protein